MKKYSLIISCFLLLDVSQAIAQTEAELELIRIAGEIAGLELEIQLLEDENDVENLQRIFGFYTDKHQWAQAADLFASDATIELGGSGVYVGKENIQDYLQSLGEAGPQEGILDDHMQLQPVIHVYRNGTAKGRWHQFSQEAEFGVSHHWGAGTYENEYVKQDGVWKIGKLHLYSTMRTPVDDGWHVTALPRTQPSEELPPDLPSNVEYENYPAVYVVPFHYDNPVTGNDEGGPEASAVGTVDISTTLGIVSIASLGIRQSDNGEANLAAIEELEHRLGLLEDADEVERLQTIYGYYLARNQWDELTGIFAPDGTIEIAMRGVYRGAESIRRNLDLYGVQDELPGQLHNHMQYQPVIHIAEDGQTANLRSRAFSMMGTFGNQGRFMGGTYENIYVKRDGVWMLYKDQQINTYFAGTDDGWINLSRSAPPGITEANPPDEPPTMNFEMYPKAFLPPYHYENPVTGSTDVVE
ncbi:MAG: nuclear transport factor 2 family protein [Gammaproteobacteria bacterium]|nr:nuclear transport factor 2 family protein [Gammaproteobacteria bacterium]